MEAIQTINTVPTIVVENKLATFGSKCRKAVSKFINTYLVFFMMPTGMAVTPGQQVWKQKSICESQSEE